MVANKRMGAAFNDLLSLSLSLLALATCVFVYAAAYAGSC